MSSTSEQVREYRRTVPGLITLIYANQKMTSKKAGRPPPSYTKEQFRQWITQQPNFDRLFQDWQNSGFEKDLSPSVDRLDNTVGYTLDNIQLITWRQNLLNQKRQNVSGAYLVWNSKAIRQLTLDGEVVAEYPSIRIALRALGRHRLHGASNIVAIANGKWKSAYGFKWEWVDPSHHPALS
jgi:hypothetical protein